jgi:hypothetical protein
MRTSSIFSVGLVLACTWASTAVAQVAVETYSVTYIIDVNLPGTPSGGGIDFGGAGLTTTLSFTPGSVTFEGQPVDFSGTEASFLAGTYTGSAHVPVTGGPAAVPVDGQGTSTGGVNSTWDLHANPVELGPAFSGINLDVVIGQMPGGQASTTNWNSAVVPELNGASLVTVGPSGSATVTNVDPIIGLVDVVCGSGVINATSGVAVPTVTEWGLIILTLGFIGIALMMLRRRQLEAGGATPAT